MTKGKRIVVDFKDVTDLCTDSPISRFKHAIEKASTGDIIEVIAYTTEQVWTVMRWCEKNNIQAKEMPGTGGSTKIEIVKT